MDETILKEYLALGKQIALKAGEIMLKYFNQETIQQHEKSDFSIVTIADEEINQLVIDEVEKTYPTHSVYGEEASSEKHTDNVWACDPIDGTLVYSKGLPVSVFSLAFVKNGVPLVGIVFDPFQNRLYTAIKNCGAFLNDKQIHVSQLGLTYQSTIDFHWWPEAIYDIMPGIHQISLDTKAFVLSNGSAIQGFCSVARGVYEAAIFPGGKGKNVDVAATKVIIEEAGGKVTDFFGNDQRYDQDIKGAIVSNGQVHDALLEYLKVLPD